MNNRLRPHQNYRCYFASYRGVRVLIPGCWGAAINGIGGCTCPANMLNDTDVIAAVREAADNARWDSVRVGALGSHIREVCATRATMLYAAAARLEALLMAAAEQEKPNEH